MDIRLRNLDLSYGNKRSNRAYLAFSFLQRLHQFLRFRPWREAETVHLIRRQDLAQRIEQLHLRRRFTQQFVCGQ